MLYFSHLEIELYVSLMLQEKLLLGSELTVLSQQYLGCWGVN